MITAGQIYACIDRIAPFATQEKWDNSGLLVGAPGDTVTGVLVSLDISPAAVQEAARLGCDLIVSHHPVIFSPLHTLDSRSIPYQLARRGIAAVCCHTPLDMAPGGINDILAGKLSSVLPVQDTGERETLCGSEGRILTLSAACSVHEIAAAAKNALGIPHVRYTMDRSVQRLGLCSGSGSSMLEEVDGACDCLLTGDIKHDRWYKAQELGIGLIDCGHYHTEVIAVQYLARVLREAFPELPVTAFEEGDPVAYA